MKLPVSHFSRQKKTEEPIANLYLCFRLTTKLLTLAIVKADEEIVADAADAEAALIDG